jgi:predicted nucleic acid-binding Zn ribbon protein
MKKDKMQSRKRKMSPLGDILEQMAKFYNLDDQIRENQVIAKWPEIVGEMMASVTEPIRVKDGILYLKVKNASWRNELIFQKINILRNIEKFTDKRIITEIVLL